MTPPDDRRVAQAADGTGPRGGDAAPRVASLPPVYRYLILLTAVLSAASLALTVAANTHRNAPAQDGDPARPHISGCQAPGRGEMPLPLARGPQADDGAPDAHLAGAVLGCRLQLI